MGNDNPYAALWTLIGAKLFSRPDGTVLDRTVQGTSPLIGFNWSNSVNPVLGAQDKCNETMEITRINGIRAQIRRDLGFEGVVRLEHHITETYKSIVRQPYDRLEELVEIADHVANISAKHEGGDPAVDETREHPSDVLDYFRDRSKIKESGDMPHLLRNYGTCVASAWTSTTRSTAPPRRWRRTGRPSSRRGSCTSDDTVQ